MPGTMVTTHFLFCKLHKFIGDVEPEDEQSECAACWVVYYKSDQRYDRRDTPCDDGVAFRKAVRKIFGPRLSWGARAARSTNGHSSNPQHEEHA